MSTFLYRVMGAATLDAGMYETIEADQRATRQAVGVVIVAALALAIGLLGFYDFDPWPMFTITALALVGWIGWAVLILRVGGWHLRQAGTRVTLGELLRTIGFAAVPGWLQVFALIPAVGVAAFAIAWAWMLAAVVVAVKHALDFGSTWRALLVCGVALGLVVTFMAIFAALLGPAATGALGAAVGVPAR
jgi:hypothetical protein